MEEEKLLMKRDTLPGFTPFSVEACPVNAEIIAVYGLKDHAVRPSVLVIDCRKQEILTEIENTFYFAWAKNAQILYYSDSVTDAQKQENYSRVAAYHADTDELETIFADQKNSVLGEVHAASNERYFMFEIWDDYSHSRFYSYDTVTGKICDVTMGTAVEMKYIDSMCKVHYFIQKETTPFGQVIAIEEGKQLSDAVVVMPEGNEVLDSGFILNQKIYVQALQAACARLICIEKNENGYKRREIKLPSEVGTLAVCGRADSEVFFKFESFTMPPMLMSFDGEEMKVLKKSAECTHPDVVVEQRYAKSIGDHKEIPYFIVRHKDCVPGMDAPVWMYGYGGYNFSSLPGYENGSFGLQIADWAEKGGIYVLASIRGGNEFGTEWHKEGMKLNKKNCYYDIIGITEQLIEEKWTKAEKIIFSGASNGGLMVSALATMRPDLFGCIIASVPQTDMIQVAEDDRGAMYITEYGNPKESKEMLEYLLDYSPYHNIVDRTYPWMYIQTGECDNNVPPYHGKKFAAKLQEQKSNPNPVLLRVLEKGSHDRGMGEVYWKTISEMQLFAEKAIGKK